MNYYIKQTTAGRFEVLDLHANKKLDGTDAHPRAALSKALFHAYSTYGTIVGGEIVPPRQSVKVSYKDSFIDVHKVAYTYGCKYKLTKLKASEKEPQLAHIQLSLF